MVGGLREDLVEKKAFQPNGGTTGFADTCTIQTGAGCDGARAGIDDMWHRLQWEEVLIPCTSLCPRCAMNTKQAINERRKPTRRKFLPQVETRFFCVTTSSGYRRR